MHKDKLRSRLKQAGKDSKKCLKNVAWQTCKCVLYIICAPCLCCACALLCLPRKRRRGCCVRQGRSVPRPIPQFPTPRPRALSLPLVEAQPYQRTASQPSSDLLTKLPSEIRRLIYAEALGGIAIHFRTAHGEPRAMKCVAPGECACSSFDPQWEESPSRGLGLLRTCRVVYSEAVEYLYSANSFSLATVSDHLDTIDYLSYYFLPQRLVQIRNMHMDWKIDSLLYHPYPEPADMTLESWFNSWKILTRMTGLRRLHIKIGYAQSFWAETFDAVWEGQGAKLLGVVKDITAPKDFVVVLPNRQPMVDIDVGDSQCVFQERGDEHQAELADYF